MNPPAILHWVRWKARHALLAAYHPRYPSLALLLTTASSGRIIERVRAGTLAAALVDDPAPGDERNGGIAFQEQRVLISGLGYKPSKNAADASSSTRFTFRPDCSCRLRFEAWFLKQKAQPASIMEIRS